MSLKITFPDTPTTPHSLEVLQKLSNGKFNVYETYSPSHNATYALKAFPQNLYGTTRYNKESIMFTFSHPNIIKHIPAAISAENLDHFHSILTEFARYGDLLDLVTLNILNSEILIRTYFHQIVAGLEYIHSQGVAHLDLKLANLMIGSGFTLKIIDFDQAQRFTDQEMTSCGTEGFRAPEVIARNCEDFIAADIYSLGVILYALKAHDTPFKEVITVDESAGNKSTLMKHYSIFLSDNRRFWEIKRDLAFFSEDFKELVNGMLQYDVTKRYRLSDVKNSKWFKGTVLSEKKLRAEMNAKWEVYQRK